MNDFFLQIQNQNTKFFTKTVFSFPYREKIYGLEFWIFIPDLKKIFHSMNDESQE